MNKNYTIIAQNISFLEDMCDDDQAVVGIYSIDVKEPDHHEPEQICTAVLNRFHENYGIEVLDDFNIQVFDRNGDEIFEGDEEVDANDVALDDPVFITEDPTDEWYDAD